MWSDSSQSFNCLNVTEKLNTCKVAVQTVQTSHFQDCWPVHHSSPVCWLCGRPVKGSWSRLNTVGILVCLFGNKFAGTFEWTFSSLDQTTKCTLASYMTEECAGENWLRPVSNTTCQLTCGYLKGSNYSWIIHKKIQPNIFTGIFKGPVLFKIHSANVF